MFVAIPKSHVEAWQHKPFSEMVAAIGTDGILDAHAEYLERQRINEALPESQRRNLQPWPHAMIGFAVFRDGGTDARTPDTALLFFQGY